MSKRFGRNQRRRAREALAAEMQQSSTMARLAESRLMQYKNASRELDLLREFFYMIAQRVGRESILVGGEAEAELDGPDVRSFLVHIREEANFYCGINAIPTMEMAKVQMMNRLEVKAVRDSFAQQVVVRCYLGMAEAGIAMSEMFLVRSTEDELTYYISKELARNLARDIKRLKP